MIRLIKLLLGLVALVAFVWFGANISLGSRTLFQHLQAIGKTQETQELWEGAKGSAEPLIDNVKRRLAAQGEAENRTRGGQQDAGATPAPAAPPETISSTDRQKLRQVLGSEQARR